MGGIGDRGKKKYGVGIGRRKGARGRQMQEVKRRSKRETYERGKDEGTINI